MSYCYKCGLQHTEQESVFPKICSCGYRMFKDPQNGYVCCGIIELIDGGFWLIQRGSNPKNGWAFPGGFSNVGEHLEKAVQREIFEETNIFLNFELFEYYSNDVADNQNNIIFFKYKEKLTWDFIIHHFKQTPEAISIKKVLTFENLCFKTHTKVLKTICTT